MVEHCRVNLTLPFRLVSELLAVFMGSSHVLECLRLFVVQRAGSICLSDCPRGASGLCLIPSRVPFGRGVILVKCQTSFARLLDSRVEVEGVPWPKFLGPQSASPLRPVFGKTSLS